MTTHAHPIPQPEPAPARAGTVGFVEDNDEDFALFSRVFSKRWRVERWPTGEAAAEAFASGDPRARAVDVLMIDHDLPGMNGIAVIERLRALAGERAPVLCMVSGTGRPGIGESALDAGADAFFTKPGSVAGLRGLADEISTLASGR